MPKIVKREVLHWGKMEHIFDTDSDGREYYNGELLIEDPDPEKLVWDLEAFRQVVQKAVYTVGGDIEVK